MINLRTEWSGGPKSTNGAYGFYPVESEDVLIDGCVAIGAYTLQGGSGATGGDGGNIAVGYKAGYLVGTSAAADNVLIGKEAGYHVTCLLYTSPSPRDRTRSRMPSSA